MKPKDWLIGWLIAINVDFDPETSYTRDGPISFYYERSPKCKMYPYSKNFT